MRKKQVVKKADEKPNNGMYEWTSIIKAVRNPLAFFTLALLILQGILMALIGRAHGIDYRILLIATLFLTLLLIMVVWSLAYKTSPREYRITLDQNISEYRYDAFVSSPMAALSDKDYQAERVFTLDVIDELKTSCGIKDIYYAGSDIDSKKKFSPNDVAVMDDLDAITRSKQFILIYPKKVASSVLFEAGIALGLGKSCIYFVKDRKHLPFLMRQAEQAFKNIKVYEYINIDDIKRICKNRKIFNFD
jgi:hypothetical protein